MKPFNLEEAKRGYPIITREGNQARILEFDLKNTQYNIAAIVTESDGTETAITFTEKGEQFQGEKSSLDLFIGYKKKYGWTWVYYEPDVGFTNGAIYETEKEAMNAKQNDKVATLNKVEWTE